MVLIPIYQLDESAGCWGYSFTPADLSDSPAAWAWIPDGCSFTPSPDGKCEMLVVPGRSSALYPHELLHMANRLDALPFAGIGDSVEPPDEA